MPSAPAWAKVLGGIMVSIILAAGGLLISNTVSLGTLSTQMTRVEKDIDVLAVMSVEVTTNKDHIEGLSERIARLERDRDPEAVRQLGDRLSEAEKSLREIKNPPDPLRSVPGIPYRGR